MAARTTALTEYTDNGNSRTSFFTGHTVQVPRLVLERRKVPTGSQSVSEYSFTVLGAAKDPEGNVLPSKVALACTFRVPMNIDAADTTVADIKAVFLDLVNSDEFAASMSTLGWQ